MDQAQANLELRGSLGDVTAARQSGLGDGSARLIDVNLKAQRATVERASDAQSGAAPNRDAGGAACVGRATTAQRRLTTGGAQPRLTTVIATSLAVSSASPAPWGNMRRQARTSRCSSPTRSGSPNYKGPARPDAAGATVDIEIDSIRNAPSAAMSTAFSPAPARPSRCCCRGKRHREPSRSSSACRSAHPRDPPTRPLGPGMSVVPTVRRRRPLSMSG